MNIAISSTLHCKSYNLVTEEIPLVLVQTGPDQPKQAKISPQVQRLRKLSVASGGDVAGFLFLFLLQAAESALPFSHLGECT